MPRIDWHSLPSQVKQHLVERLKQREITPDDLEALKLWIGGNPEVPDGPWCKGFGTFTLAGEGKFPKTFLTKHQLCAGQKL